MVSREAETEEYKSANNDLKYASLFIAGTYLYFIFCKSAGIRESQPGSSPLAFFITSETLPVCFHTFSHVYSPPSENVDGM